MDKLSHIKCGLARMGQTGSVISYLVHSYTWLLFGAYRYCFVIQYFVAEKNADYLSIQYKGFSANLYKRPPVYIQQNMLE